MQKTIERVLDRTHAAALRNPWLQRFTAFTRLLLAVGFIPPSIPKILHQPFTVLPETNPVGAYFGALYRTGFYYEFIGWGQITAALLLLFPRTAHLGALLFLPIIANIAVLTFSVGFKGTVYITALMLVAVLYLVAWEYDRLKPVLLPARVERTSWSSRDLFRMPAFFAAGGVSLAAIFIAFGVGNLHRRPLAVITGLALAGAVFGLACALHHRSMGVGALERRGE